MALRGYETNSTEVFWIGEPDANMQSGRVVIVFDDEKKPQLGDMVLMLVLGGGCFARWPVEDPLPGSIAGVVEAYVQVLA